MNMSPPFPLRPWIVLLCLTPGFTAAAESASALPVTTITATFTEQPITAVPTTVTVKEQTDIDRENINTIRDLVRHEPGVSVGGTGHAAGINGFNIRGIDGNRVLTQIDGVTVPDVYAFGPYANTRRNYVDPDLVKRVEILRGPASALYGSDAIGGAVSYFTLDPEDLLREGRNYGARFKTGYSSADRSWLTSGTVAGRTGDFDALVHYGKRSGHETESYGGHHGLGSSRTAANPEDHDSYNVLAKLGYHYGDDSRLQLTYEHYRSRLDGDIKSAPTRIFGVQTRSYLGRNVVDVEERERFSLENALSLTTGFADRWTTLLSYQNGGTDQRTYQPNSSASYYRKTTYEEHTWAFDNKLDKHFAMGESEHLVTYGLRYEHQEVNGLRTGTSNRGVANLYASDFPSPAVDTWGTFVQDQIDIGAWTFLPALRYDHTTLKPDANTAYLAGLASGTAFDDSEKSWHHVSPKLGVTYRFNDRYSAFGQYAEGFRTPTPKALYGNFTNESAGYQVVGNADLDPETSRGVELGFRGHFDQGNFSVAVFYNKYRDFIEEDALGGGGSYAVFQSSNISHATIKGAEAKGHLELDTVGLPEGVYSEGTIAYAWGRNDDTGQPLNSVSPLTGVFSLGYDDRAGQYGGRLDWTLVQRKKRVDDARYHAADGSTQFRTPGFGVLDLTAYYKLTRDLTVNAGLYNLTDRKYWLWDDLRGYDTTGEGGMLAPANIDRLSQPGRNVSMNIVWEI
ncbi:TonB-dependent hemoglobin/transferrin/lactoferrin family receptor (plasmid) [Pseudomonas luteola]|uniref:TonB-dependent hemoglobin/transferrin/lactoferrin family receptor n=1 Tax=Pseudomonas luteola TaxID=47886 RepID=UPI003DA00C28